MCFGKTVQVTSSGLKGMLDGKRLNVFISAGRRYGSGLKTQQKIILRRGCEPSLTTLESAIYAFSWWMEPQPSVEATLILLTSSSRIFDHCALFSTSVRCQG
jgi:hypothetical protein